MTQEQLERGKAKAVRNDHLRDKGLAAARLSLLASCASPAFHDFLVCKTQVGQVALTRGIQAIGFDDENALATVLNKVRTFDAWSEDNDPWHEHDFGKIEFQGKDIFWKVDEYGMDEGGLTLTIMLAEEY